MAKSKKLSPEEEKKKLARQKRRKNRRSSETTNSTEEKSNEQEKGGGADSSNFPEIDEKEIKTEETIPKAESGEGSKGPEAEEVNEESNIESDEPVVVIEPDKEVSETGEGKDEAEQETFNFQELCEKVSAVLRTFPGTKLNCRLKVIVDDKTAIIHQGPIGNIWARLSANGDHNFYRHAIKRTLQEDESTAEYFKNIM